MKLKPTIDALVAVALTSATLHCAAESPMELRERLEQMGTADQAVRAKIEPVLASGKFDTAEFKAVAAEVASVDARNLSDLKAIIVRNGWPDARVVGIDAGNSAFLILQHSPLEAQKELLPTFRDAVFAGKARSDHLAMLEDRILIGDGRKQRYGTQITAGPDGKPRIAPVEHPASLDARRKAVGLRPMDEYLEQVEARIGRAIDRSTLVDQSGP